MDRVYNIVFNELKYFHLYILVVYLEIISSNVFFFSGEKLHTSVKKPVFLASEYAEWPSGRAEVRILTMSEEPGGTIYSHNIDRLGSSYQAIRTVDAILKISQVNAEASDQSTSDEC